MGLTAVDLARNEGHTDVAAYLNDILQNGLGRGARSGTVFDPLSPPKTIISTISTTNGSNT